MGRPCVWGTEERVRAGCMVGLTSEIWPDPDLDISIISGARDRGAPQKCCFLWRTELGAPQKAAFLWRTGMVRHRNITFCGARVMVRHRMSYFCGARCFGAPQNCKILWRTQKRAPQK